MLQCFLSHFMKVEELSLIFNGVILVLNRNHLLTHILFTVQCLLDLWIHMLPSLNQKVKVSRLRFQQRLMLLENKLSYTS
jgi:hypothetical protein